MKRSRRFLVTAGLGCGDLAALVGLRPDVGTLVHDLTGPHAWVATAGADGAAVVLAGAALWCVALWLGAGLLAAVATALPGSCGQLSRTLTRVLLPAALYRVVAGAAGLGVLLAPVAAGAAGAGSSTPGASSPAPSTSAPIPAPTWPADPPALPTPGWPTSTPATGPGEPGDVVPRPDARPPHAAPPPQDGDVVVRPGDSLWSIATAQLGHTGTPARIAAAWPRWYTANRIVIGADPELIKPGERLAPPASTVRPR